MWISWKRSSSAIASGVQPPWISIANLCATAQSCSELSKQRSPSGKSACEAGDIAAICERDIAFHQAILSGCGNLDLLPIWKRLCATMRFAYSRFVNTMAIYHEHAAIVDAFDQGPCETMIQAIKANIV